jgi:thiol peroxidase
MARGIIILDENDRVIYQELVSEITAEPDYASALAVLA